MVKDQSYWLHKLATLKIDRARGDPAPHKPFLLLMILEMADRGEITGSELPLSPDLAFRFSLFNSVITARQRPPLELRLPFHHLKTSGIWQPLMADGKSSPHRNLTVKVRFDPAFLDCLRDATFRDKAKRVLIETSPYFRIEERIALCTMLRLKPAAADELKEASPLYTAPVQRGRSAFPHRSGCRRVQTHLRVDGLPDDYARHGKYRGRGPHPRVQREPKQRPAQRLGSLQERALAVRPWPLVNHRRLPGTRERGEVH